MNIFYLDRDPARAAEMMHDKHVVKMILETAQILSTVCHRHGVWKDGMYRPTHPHHPSVLWAGDSAAHFNWLVDHGQHLCNEYHHRYGRLHKSGAVIDLCGAEAPTQFPAHTWTDPTQAMPEEFKVPGDSVAAYRAYYLGRKVEQSKWTRRPVPTFVLEGIAIMARKKKDEAAVADTAAAPTAAPTEQKEKKGGGAVPGPRGLRGIPGDARITLLVEHNPKRPGCAAEKRFALYETGMTQAQFLAAGGTVPDLAYDSAHGFISIEGYTPKEVVRKAKAKASAEPKAEGAEPKKRGRKSKVDAPAAPVTAEATQVEQEVVEETID